MESTGSKAHFSGSGYGRSPSPPTHSWPLTSTYRAQVRSCIEFSPAASPKTPMSESHAFPGTGGANPRAPIRRISNPFLLDFSMLEGAGNNGGGLDGGDEDQEEEFEDVPDFSTSHSLSLLSNDDGGDEDDDDTLSSNGDLSEVFDALSRFSEVCLASVEALCSPVEGGTAITPRATYSYSDLPFLSTFTHPVGTAESDLPKDSATSSTSADNLYFAHHQSVGYEESVLEIGGRFGQSVTATRESWTSEMGRMRPSGATNISNPSPSAFQFSTNFKRNRNLGKGEESGGQETPNADHPIPFPGESKLELMMEENSILSLLETPFDWEGRCADLEVALQRFGEQAGRVRHFLRDKVRNSFSHFFFLTGGS